MGDSGSSVRQVDSEAEGTVLIQQTKPDSVPVVAASGLGAMREPQL